MFIVCTVSAFTCLSNSTTIARSIDHVKVHLAAAAHVQRVQIGARDVEQHPYAIRALAHRDVLLQVLDLQHRSIEIVTTLSMKERERLQ